ncbi:cytochrome C oxidase subunit IV family protein [Gemmatimonas sp.]|uniref:cytochrome C oxidase subunit IV family protein n=1 Tax=Gemmatimonas sp. TaxID=1962908 RepID=UPI00286DA1BB|nr:cytochrome C oxidase subunit IV family protein [Gemmatimonas sp.]
MADHSPAAGHAHDEAHHPTWTTYWKIAVILTVITAVEVSAYYIKAWEESWVYVPSMLIMSAVKFYIVVMYYMHLKYDHKLFRSLFTGPLIVAGLTLIGLLFLFSKLVLRLGLLS